MKTKQQIEQLAEKECTHHFDLRIGYFKGYTQCLEDIRKDWQNYTISEKSDFIEFLNKQD